MKKSVGLMAAALCAASLSASAGEIFVNGSFAGGAKPAYWSGVPAASGKMSLKHQPDKKHILVLDAVSKLVQTNTSTPFQVKAGDKISFSFSAKGKGVLRCGLLGYTYSADSRGVGMMPSSFIRPTAEWKEYTGTLTVKDFAGKGPTEECRFFFTLNKGGCVEIRNLVVKSERDFGHETLGNPSFEFSQIANDGLYPWFVLKSFGSAKVCSDDAAAGSRCLEISCTPDQRTQPMASFTRYAGIRQDRALKPNTEYTVSCKIKTDLNDGKCGIAVQFVNEYSWSPSAPLRHYTMSKDNNGEGWKEVTYTFKTPEKRNRAWIFICGENIDGRFFVDDVQLKEGK